jgi:hypothetical protein
MTKLRHLVGDNLKELERELNSLEGEVEVKAINLAGHNWYIHFVVQEQSLEPKKNIKEKRK